MNILMDELPYTVFVTGKEIPINTDYRTGILFEQALSDLEMPDDEKLDTVLRLYYGDVIFPLLDSMDTVKEALDNIMWFYRCGADIPARSESEEETSGKDLPFSYEHDAGYIYAAFLETYKIDLTKNRLHWWQFRALFLGLPETTLFCKIMAYRTMEIPAKMPKERKEFYRRMKRIYKIPESAEQIRLEKELEAILASGGDISQLIK
ncbi:MAG: bacteriophage Gp15 family protein [Lachnospiraceae bacterium]